VPERSTPCLERAECNTTAVISDSSFEQIPEEMEGLIHFFQATSAPKKFCASGDFVDQQHR